MNRMIKISQGAHFSSQMLSNVSKILNACCLVEKRTQ